MKRWLGKARQIVLASLAAAGLCAPLALAQQGPWHRNYFPNVALQDHNGRTLRFYDDVIRGKVVAINFIYTNCTDICPLDTAKMRQIQDLLGARVGRDVFMYSISINPERDTPESLRRFMRTYDVGPGWTFMTGSRADVDMLQRKLGMRPVDPTSLNQHDTSIMVGNEATGQWIKRSSFENPQLIADLLGETLTNYATRSPNAGARVSYANAGRITDTTQGAYLFRTRCQSCHTVGGGDRLGPDLRGVTRARNPAWLTRWIKEPDKMIAERDPTAIALMARYRNLPMPNLRLGEEDVAAIVDYLKAQDAAASPQR